MDETGKSQTGEIDSLLAQVAELKAQLEESRRDRDTARHLLAEEARQRAGLEKELKILERLADPSPTEVTARLFGSQALKDRLPELFQDLVDRYGILLDQSLEQQNFRVEYPVSDSLRAIADRLGQLLCGPRDVVDLHHAALRAKTASVTATKARALGDEGRYVILELMGLLLSFYRNRSFASAGPAASNRAVPSKTGANEEKHG
jgi:transposase